MRAYKENKDWLWDRKIPSGKVKRILNNPDDSDYVRLASLLFSRKNSPREVFNYLKPIDFCRNWQKIKREMRKDSWNNPRIEFWQAIYEKLLQKYKKRGKIIFAEKKYREFGELCKYIGSKIREVRQENKLTQRDLAKRLHISQQMISRIEKGKENLSIITLENIATHLGKKLYFEFR